MVKHLPTLRKTQVRSLGWEDPLEKEMETHSSTFAWENPMDGEAWWATVHRVAESDTTERLHLLTLGSYTGFPPHSSPFFSSYLLLLFLGSSKIF